MNHKRIRHWSEILYTQYVEVDTKAIAVVTASLYTSNKNTPEEIAADIEDQKAKEVFTSRLKGEHLGL